MSAAERRGAPPPRREHRASINQDSKYPRRLLARPRHPAAASPRRPDGLRRECHADRSPVYVSFVSKAILWERGLCRQTAHKRPNHGPLLCPRFLSHMTARPEDLRPPCVPSSGSRPLPPPREKTAVTHALAAPKTQTLDGFFRLHPDGRRKSAPMAGRRSAAVVVPCPPPSAAPPPRTANPTPPRQNSPHGDFERRRRSRSASPCDEPPAPGGGVEVRETAPRPAAASPHPGCRLPAEPNGLEAPPPAASSSSSSSISHGSLSDFSRPPSSRFSRSTDLASGRSSVLSGDLGDSEPGGSVCSSPLQPRPVTGSPSAPRPPPASHPRQPSANASATPLLYEPLFGQTRPLSPPSTSGGLRQSDNPPSRSESPDATKYLQPVPSEAPGPHPSMASDRGLVGLAFPSATWSSCPSPQRTTPRSSGSGPAPTPLASAPRLESRRWSPLPPISPVGGRCGTAASRYSELSCTQSRAFDELEAIAPRSLSSPSLDRLSDSSGCPSPDTAELSPGLAALTVGCDSGTLGSLSRVQLLLLDRPQPDTRPGLFGPEEELSPVQDWPRLGIQYEGGVRPRTAGGVSERCDSAGKVHENKSEGSEDASGSPSSWIIDPSPSLAMLRSALSPCVSDLGSSGGEGGPAEEEEEANYPGWGQQVKSSAAGRRPASLDGRSEERKRRMEERKTKVLSLLSKLQDDGPRQPKGHRSCSNFQDFDFLAKYCIFSQEKLAEYKRAFEAEDADDDGYISCLQALLALKSVIPAERLSDEEEIYVYRILEMVDFSVTDGLVDLRLFAVIASLAQKVAAMDEFMRSLITDMDFRSLEVRLFKAKQLFLFLMEEQQGDAGAQRGSISAEQLLLELKAGGIHLEQEAAVRLELQRIPPLDLLDFLAYLPLFMLIHKSVIANPLNDSGDL
ncbi:uncharacterized protein LOC120818181 isoform X3 [Gasterosteus aculeatus]